MSPAPLTDADFEAEPATCEAPRCSNVATGDCPGCDAAVCDAHAEKAGHDCEAGSDASDLRAERELHF